MAVRGEEAAFGHYGVLAGEMLVSVLGQLRLITLSQVRLIRLYKVMRHVSYRLLQHFVASKKKVRTTRLIRKPLLEFKHGGLFPRHGVG